MGRPSIYTQELADKICLGLMEGKSLRSVCTADDMPDRASVYNWLQKNQDFFGQYTRAREVQAEHYADEINDIADDGSNDYMMVMRGAQEVEVINHENIQRSRLRVDSRKWIVSKLLPKKYGDKVQTEISGPEGAPLTLKVEFVNGQS